MAGGSHNLKGVVTIQPKGDKQEAQFVIAGNISDTTVTLSGANSINDAIERAESFLGRSLRIDEIKIPPNAMRDDLGFVR